jgi:SAM-dependent methyltransferase
VRRCLQLAVDMLHRPVEQLRVLDLGALEGQFAIEFALHGAEVVAIEGRRANVEKAALARDVLGLERLELREEDVRGLDRERHGAFDVVLCLGLLYHLDGDDVFAFIDRLAEVCTGLLILDTHVALKGRDTHRHAGREYRGLRFVEHSPRATQAQRDRSLWASLDNAESFWPTRASLVNALARAGFSSVLECAVPGMRSTRDRITLAALRGEPVALRSPPPGRDRGPADVPESTGPRRVRNQSRVFLAAKRVALRLLVERERFAPRKRRGRARPS